MLELRPLSGPVRTPVQELESWGGVECTVNRVGDEYRDQLIATGHEQRAQDFELLSGLGLDALRFPILWERVSPLPGSVPDWSWSDQGLAALQRLGIRPIVGLIHHGSGPRHTSLIDRGFAQGLADHAARTAERYPWVTDWTPVNEPLTTARFAALYGVWYPHARDEKLFWTALLNQVDATRLAMRAIRKVQPAARLIQTDDLGRTYGTPATAEQVAFDNQRRWMSWDLLCGLVGPPHPLWSRLCAFGLGERLQAILADPCPPGVIGINHYLTSDRLLDERADRYPADTRGGNKRRTFADVEAIRVVKPAPQGLAGAIDEAWHRYRLPIAVTEVHNGCTREEQLRWLSGAWRTAHAARERGVDVRAVTAWALFGSKGWNTLLTGEGVYEPGAFDVSSGTPRETALAAAIRARGETPPAITGAGWWQRDLRLSYPASPRPAPMAAHRTTIPKGEARPILITGATGTLGGSIAAECRHRDLAHVLTSRRELELCDPASIARALDHHRPWAVINAAGWVRVDDAEDAREACFQANATGAIALAQACATRGIACASFSSDLVFDGLSGTGYCETDPVSPLGVYGESKAEMERGLTSLGGLIVRTAAFFSPHDRHNFAIHCLDTLRRKEHFAAVSDCTVSPSYVPDLCRLTIDLLIDGEQGIWHLTNGEAVTWFEFAHLLAVEVGEDPNLITALPAAEAGWRAPRPASSALISTRGQPMPSLRSAITRFANHYRMHGTAQEQVIRTGEPAC